MKVGFIGLGTMGSRMATRLKNAGHDLVLNDMRKASAEPFLKDGAVWADTPRQVGEQADIVFTSVPGPPEVEEVALGANGLIHGLKKGGALFDVSTNSVDMVKKVEKAFADKGLYMLDAPVSGGPGGAASGALAIWVGGDEATFQKYKPVLDALGDQARYMGGISTGTVTKLVHNVAAAAMNGLLAEVMSLGIKAGIDPLALFASIRQGAGGRRRMFDSLARAYLIDKYEPADFAFKLVYKDVSLATQLGRDLKVPMRLSNTILDDMTDAMNRGWGEQDARAFMKLQTERAKSAFPPVDAQKAQAVLKE